MRRVSCLTAAIALFGVAASLPAAEKLGLSKGDVTLQSAGPLAFGPDGVLFVADPKAAVIYAVDTGEKPGARPLPAPHAAGLQAQVVELGGKDAKIADLAVNPLTGTVFVSIRGAHPSIAKVEGGKLAAVSLKDIPNARTALPNPPEDKETTGPNGRPPRNLRNDSITDLAYVDGQVIASGLVNSKSGSSVQAFPFPFDQKSKVAGLEIYHAAHGRLEDYAPIRAFIPFNINGQPHLLAGFQCTPLVKFPLSQVSDGQQIKGTTLAELGNRNQPLDMIAYEKDGEHHILVANSARGVMKVSTRNIDRDEGLTAPVGGGGTAGQEFETLEKLNGTVQLASLDEKRAVVLIENEGKLTIETINLP